MNRLSPLLLLLLIYSCQNQKPVKDSYTIEVHAPGVYNGIRAYLKIQDERGRLINKDTAIVIDEKFSFQGKRDEPSLELLTINGYKGFLPVIVENGEIYIYIEKDSLLTSKISGTANNEAYQRYFKNENSLKDKLKTLTSNYQKATASNSGDQKAILKEITQTRETLNELPITYINQNKDAFLTVLILNQAIKNRQLKFEQIESIYNSLSQELKISSYGNKTGAYITTQKQIMKAEKTTQIGNVAPNFSAPNPEGKTLALNNIKGEITIIDFWASWCGPCRRENPKVVKLYEAYHKKGLEIIGVSLDREGQKDRWLKAIEDDQLTWHHVSNLKFWQDPIAKLYNVRSIPATFILDAEGKIIAKNLRGQALEKKIAELLN
ncbi:TlpA disulfide reductase family protein [Aestuariivivens sp. NBU2969]|uniref:TlpA disulfide reductase family protein n=1 Tax=Aestuariivivens sp. NBU2969 TaxID=2873267 RepID=UPI001CBAD362|nr:TlpA disulfide reductase family protein [Aestuariivivens sp. NBU2969]